MKRIILFLLVIISFNVYSQSDEALVKATLMDYIEGTSNGYIDRIVRAFDKNANLYYSQNDSLKSRASSNYAKVFTPNKKTGRLAHIAGIHIRGNAAVGIVEVDIPNYKRRYTDYMLLMKFDGRWKVIHKSYTWEPYERKGSVLFVVSNEDSFGDSKKRTGTHFGELVDAYHEFQNAGYEVQFVSPKGGAIPVSYINLQNELQHTYFYDEKLQQKLKRTFTPSEVNVQEYDAIFYCGGSAAAFDIPNNKAIQEITRAIYEDHNGIVGGVCHGPAGFVDVQLSNGKYLVAGKEVTSFTNAEEGNAELLPFLVESKLRERGGKFRKADKWQAKIVADQRLVTGQNPASTKETAVKIIQLLAQ